MHGKAFWSDKERVGRLAVERVDASKSARIEGRGKARDEREQEERHEREPASSGVLGRSVERAITSTRDAWGSLSLVDQAESVSYATTCRLNRRNVTERYTARTYTPSDTAKEHRCWFTCLSATIHTVDLHSDSPLPEYREHERTFFLRT